MNEAESADPSVSVVVPVCSARTTSLPCVPSFIRHGDVPFELIVVDARPSSEASLQFPANPRDLSLNYVRHDPDGGFAGAVNRAAQLARGEYLLISSWDCIIGPGCLSRLAAVLDADPMVAAVSAVTNHVGEGPQVDPAARGLALADADAYAVRAASESTRARFDVPDRLDLFCVLVRREVFRELNGLCEELDPGPYVDDDFAVRVRLAGYRLAVDPQTFVFRSSSATTEWITLDIGKRRRAFYEKMAGYALRDPPAFTRAPAGAISPSVSVIVRTVDRPTLLEETLLSLANQTFRDFEVVLVRDGGSASDAIPRRFEPYLEVQLVDLVPRSGRTRALNAGLRAARGKWITTLDDDDIVYPLHLEVLVRALEASADSVGYTLLHKVLEDRENKATLLRQPFQLFGVDPTDVLIDNSIPVHSVVFERACVDVVGVFDESLVVLEDWEYLIRLSQEYRFKRIERFTGDYRFRFDHASLNMFTSAPAERLDAMRKIYALHPQRSKRVRFLRRLAEHESRSQLETLEHIDRVARSERERLLLRTGVVGGFDLASIGDDEGSPGSASPRLRLSRVGIARVAAAVRPLLDRPVPRLIGRWLERRSIRLRRLVRRLQAEALEAKAIEIESRGRLRMDA